MNKLINKKKVLAVIVMMAMMVTSYGFLEGSAYAATKVKSISLNNVGAVKVIKKGKSFKLSYSVNKGAKKSWVKFKTSKKKIATVSSKGKIKAKKKGTCKITAYSKKNKKIKKVVTIMVGTPVTAVKCGTDSSKSLGLGDSFQMSCSVTPASATYKVIKYSSSNTNIATVDGAGNVLGVGDGTATIVATAADGSGARAVCTVTVKTSPSNAKFIAHRGWSQIAPENTIPAFQLADAQKGLYGVEFDIWECQYDKALEDPLLLVMHDNTTNRMCSTSVEVKSLSRNTVGDYPVTKGNNISKYGSLKIPEFKEVINVISSAKPIIEIKQSNKLSGDAQSYILDTCLKGREAEMISFFSNTLEPFKNYSNINTMYLVAYTNENDIGSYINEAESKGIDTIGIQYTSLTAPMVEKIHNAGLQVGAWTVPDRKTAARLINMGVDYITSDDIFF